MLIFFFSLTGPMLLRYNFNTCTVVKAQQSDQGLTWHYLHVDSVHIKISHSVSDQEML